MSNLHRRTDASKEEHIEILISQLKEEARAYNRAVKSFNEHLSNHRERFDLYDLNSRETIEKNWEWEMTLDGDLSAMEGLLNILVNESHKDSNVRRHPRACPIHRDAIDHLEYARGEMIETLEEILRIGRE